LSVDLLLIHPPVVRPSEPPLGVAVLAGFLRSIGFEVDVLDLNIETFHALLQPDNLEPEDTFSRRAVKKIPHVLEEIRDPGILSDLDRYKSSVRLMERVLWLRSRARNGGCLTLTDFRHHRLSPLRSADLVQAARGGDTGCLQNVMERIVSKRVRRGRPRWIGLSVNYLSQALPAMGVAGALRKAFPDLQIAVGGSLISTWAAQISGRTALFPWIDRWISGPGEGPLSRILGKPRDPWDDLPTPSYEGFPLNLYLSPETILPLTASRGCYWGRCRFCSEATNGTPYRRAKPQELLRTMEQLSSGSGFHWLHFTDNALPPSVLRTLSQSRPTSRWYGFARFHDALLDTGFVRRLRLAGCRMLQLGLESGAQHLLDALHKGIRLTQVAEILRTLSGEGIGTYVYVLFGLPGESDAEARQTLEFVTENASYIDYLSCAILNLPRTADGPQVERLSFGRSRDDLSLYTDFRSPDGMDRREARRFLQKTFKRDPVIAALLRREPPAFTSSHAPLFFASAMDRSRVH
jgi:hypothetical protein